MMGLAGVLCVLPLANGGTGFAEVGAGLMVAWVYRVATSPGVGRPCDPCGDTISTCIKQSCDEIRLMIVST